MAIYEIPLPIDVLISTTVDILQRFAPGYIEYSLENIPGMGNFHLSQNELGFLCDLTIRKIGDGISEISFGNTKTVTNTETIEYYKQNRSKKYKQLENLKKEHLLEYIKQLRDFSKELANRKKQHIESIVQGYFSRLIKERIWTHYETGIPDYLLSFGGENMTQESAIDKLNSSISHLKKNKKGQGKLTDKQKLEALIKWDRTDKGQMLLEEFLDNEFGNTGGVLTVAKSTFHGWRKKLRDEGFYNPQEK